MPFYPKVFLDAVGRWQQQATAEDCEDGKGGDLLAAAHIAGRASWFPDDLCCVLSSESDMKISLGLVLLCWEAERHAGHGWTSCECEATVKGSIDER